MTHLLDINNNLSNFSNDLNSWFYSKNNNNKANITLEISFRKKIDKDRCIAIVDTTGRQCSRKKKKNCNNKCGLHNDRWTKFADGPTNFREAAPVKSEINKHNIKSPNNNYYEIEQENGEVIRINNDDEIFSENGEYMGIFN